MKLLSREARDSKLAFPISQGTSFCYAGASVAWYYGSSDCKLRIILRRPSRRLWAMDNIHGIGQHAAFIFGQCFISYNTLRGVACWYKLHVLMCRGAVMTDAEMPIFVKDV